MRKKAVVLLSGGMDSSTTLAIAKEQGFEVYALSLDYGQRNRTELISAREFAEGAGVKEHKVLSIDMRSIGGSALTGDYSVPKDGKRNMESPVRTSADAKSAGKSGKVPITYVPARNTVFLSVALAWAEAIGAKDIFIGVNSVDYSGYPDCRPEYIDAFQKLAGLGTASGKIMIHAPLIHMKKSEIIKKGLSLGVDYSRTQSCYDPEPGGVACGRCDSCRIRLKGFMEAGVRDPISYKERSL